MGTKAQDQASRLVNALAQRNGWPLIADPSLAFLTPPLKAALDVWEEKRRSRAMPARGDLTMRDLKTALPNIAFLDIVKDGDQTRYKVRLAGGALDTFLGSPSTGRFLDETVPRPFANKWMTVWQPAVAACVPMRYVARVEFPNRRCYMSETLNAPLATDGKTPDILLTATYFHSREDHGTRADLALLLMQELGEPARATA